MDRCAALLRGGPVLQNKEHRPLAERERRPGIAVGQAAQRCQHEGRVQAFAATGNGPIEPSLFDRPGGGRDADQAAGAIRHHGLAVALEAMANRDLSLGCGRKPGGRLKGADRARALAMQLTQFVFGETPTAKRIADEDPGPLGWHGRRGQSGIRQSPIAGHQRILGEHIQLARQASRQLPVDFVFAHHPALQAVTEVWQFGHRPVHCLPERLRGMSTRQGYSDTGNNGLSFHDTSPARIGSPGPSTSALWMPEKPLASLSTCRSRAGLDCCGT